MRQNTRSVPPRKVIPFPRRGRPALDMTPGFDEARTLVQRLGPALSLHVAEYIVLNALFLAKDESFGGRAVPTVLAGPSVDASMAVRHIAELHELHERDPKTFARLDRIYRKQRRAGAKAKREAKGAESAPLQSRTGISGSGPKGGAA